ncbi:hypothetical protein ACFL4G_13200, partial [Thermodesulfobacteriota bacterium]
MIKEETVEKPWHLSHIVVSHKSNLDRNLAFVIMADQLDKFMRKHDFKNHGATMKGTLLSLIVFGMVLCPYMAFVPTVSTAEHETIDLIDQALLRNPNNNLSAIYSIHGSGISSAHVEYLCVDGDKLLDEVWSSTPLFPVESDRFILPVLGLKPDSSYIMRVVLADHKGNQLLSDLLPFETGPLPGVLNHQFDVSGEGSSKGYVFISQTNPTSRAQGYIFALDEEGRVAWYTRIGGSRGQFFVNISQRGSLLVFVTEYSHFSKYYEIDLFGNIVGHYDVPMIPPYEEGISLDMHDFLVLPDGEKFFLCHKLYKEDLRPYGGYLNALVISSRIRRVSDGGTILFDWDYMDTFHIEDSYVD